MRREFLRNLGIEDKDIIDKILDENSADIGAAKGDVTTLENKIANLEKDIKTKDATITTLKAEADKVEGLNQKISQLETDKTNLTNDLNTKVSEIQKTHAIEGAIRDAKGKNVKAIMALLEADKITYENGELKGVTEQLDALKGKEDSSMLFGEIQPPPPAGTHFNNPPASGNNNPSTAKTFAEAVANALGKN